VRPRQRKPADPRHAEFKARLVGYWAAEVNGFTPELEMPWGAGDAGALAAFLRANPRLSAAGFQRLLQHRLDSEDHAPGEPVKVWIGSLTRYAQGPLNKFKQPKERRNDGQLNRSDDRRQHADSSAAAALRRLSGMADR
jgi:hypothetical protein